MQKNLKKLAAVLAVATALSLVGCGAQPVEEEKATISSSVSSSSTSSSSLSSSSSSVPSSTSSSSEENSEPKSADVKGTLITRDFGTYKVLEGWEEATEYSTQRKPFYIVKGTEDENPPDNISVEVGKNRYAAKEHEKFRDAIVTQLMMQIKDTGSTLLGDGYFTEDGAYLYKFTVEREDDPIVTIQYYIVGEHRYVLVHETAQKDSKEAHEAAEIIATSFVWAEE